MVASDAFVLDNSGVRQTGKEVDLIGELRNFAFLKAL